MTKDVLVTISGKRAAGMQSEDVELIIPGSYSCQNGTHTVVYDEVTEGIEGKTKNTIRIGEGGMEIVKEGLTNVRMSFLNSGKRTISCYSTPYGDLMIGIRTNDISFREEEDRIAVNVDYSMDVEQEHLSDCCISIEIASRASSGIRLTS